MFVGSMWEAKMTPSGATKEEIQAEVDKVPFWYHTIEFAHGVFSPGREGGGARAALEPQERIASKLAMACLPESLAGKTVLDVGAWDGFYSFEAEKRGARTVLATDHFVWNYPDFGIDGFLTSKRLLDSSVRYKDLDVFDISPETAGIFDVVLFLGVLYHVNDPLTALQRMARVTRELCIVETETCSVPGADDVALLQFLPHTSRGNDPTNRWAPNLEGLEQMLLFSGFKRVELVKPPKFRSKARFWKSPRRFSRGTFHAYKD
jgi:tRNA (mo5U34)-methyltransferase